VARGVTGRLETWRTGKTHPDMIVPDIEEGARWTVEENVKVGPRIITLGAIPRPSSARCRVLLGGVSASGRELSGRGNGPLMKPAAQQTTAHVLRAYELSYATVVKRAGSIVTSSGKKRRPATALGVLMG
jgi:hypothetical protein